MPAISLRAYDLKLWRFFTRTLSLIAWRLPASCHKIKRRPTSAEAPTPLQPFQNRLSQLTTDYLLVSKTGVLAYVTIVSVQSFTLDRTPPNSESSGGSSDGSRGNVLIRRDSGVVIDCNDGKNSSALASGIYFFPFLLNGSRQGQRMRGQLMRVVNLKSS